MAWISSSLAGWMAHSGYVTQQQVMDILNSPAFMSAAVAVASAVWGLVTHTQSNTVAAANSIPSVAGVIMTNTGDGRAIADAVQTQGVAVAGTASAKVVAAPQAPVGS